jgi:hypothetical protein
MILKMASKRFVIRNSCKKNGNKPALANVNFHGALSVDRETLVWIDGNAEEARVGVDELILVPDN